MKETTKRTALAFLSVVAIFIAFGVEKADASQLLPENYECNKVWSADEECNFQIELERVKFCILTFRLVEYRNEYDVYQQLVCDKVIVKLREREEARQLKDINYKKDSLWNIYI